MIENGVETWERMTLMRSQWLIFGNILLSFCSAALRFPSVLRKRDSILCSCVCCRIGDNSGQLKCTRPLLKTKGVQKWLSRVTHCIAQGWKSWAFASWRYLFLQQPFSSCLLFQLFYLTPQCNSTLMYKQAFSKSSPCQNWKKVCIVFSEINTRYRRQENCISPLAFL